MTTFLKIIDGKIRRAFSDAAVQYDVLTGLHKEIGRELLAKVAAHEGNGPILDVGMGTGWFTGRLKNYFPDARVVGIDLAEGMVDVAKMQEKDCAIIQADARQMPFKNDTFELIASNLAYQWVDNLSEAFAHCHEILKDQGKLHLTMFGHDTFRELFESLEKTSDKSNVALKRLATCQEVSAALTESGFRDVSVGTESIKVHFPDMFALVKWVKDIGANALVGDIFIGRDWFSRANTYYNRTFADQWGVSATFEVIWVQATK